MIVCPVCEHPQDHGSECDLCGKRFGRIADGFPDSTPPLEGLEPTRLQAGAPAAVSAFPELEPTHHGAGPALPVDRTPDLEPTRAAPTGVPPAAPPVPDLERTQVEPLGDAPTAAPANPACRYCRTPPAPGERICGRCGMRLPRPVVRAADRAAEQASPVCSCGAPVRGATCPACGARHAPAGR